MGEGAGQSPELDRFRRAVEDHWKYAQAATVASGCIEVQRILLTRELLRKMNTELSPDAADYPVARRLARSTGR